MFRTLFKHTEDLCMCAWSHKFNYMDYDEYKIDEVASYRMKTACVH